VVAVPFWVLGAGSWCSGEKGEGEGEGEGGGAGRGGGGREKARTYEEQEEEEKEKSREKRGGPAVCSLQSAVPGAWLWRRAVAGT
jgi:hypothetical protein